MTCPPDHSHKIHCYARHKCRCEQCREARNQVYRRNYYSMAPEERAEYNLRRRLRQRKVDAFVFEPWQIEVALRVFGK